METNKDTDVIVLFAVKDCEGYYYASERKLGGRTEAKTDWVFDQDPDASREAARKFAAAKGARCVRITRRPKKQPTTGGALVTVGAVLATIGDVSPETELVVRVWQGNVLGDFAKVVSARVDPATHQLMLDVTFDDEGT